MSELDVIYILGKGSSWQNNEIRYSLRSVEKHLKNFRKVFIVGTKPDFLNDGVIEIPYQDVYTNKARNIMAKINRACYDERVTENFILFNDDYFLLKDINAVEYPYYYKCDLTHTVKIQFNEYKKHALVTLNALQSGGFKTINFDSHYPIIYNKKKFKKVIDNYSWNIPHGYILKSLYCNVLGIAGEFKKDCKISGAYQLKGILSLNENREMFSTSDMAMNQYMRKYIDGLYPEKSRFER